MVPDPVVAHLVRTWIHPSETFIHGQVTGSERWRSLVLARRLRSPEALPLAGQPLWTTTEGLGGGARALANLHYRLRLLSAWEARTTARRLAAAGVDLLHAHFGTDARFFRPLWRRLHRPLVVSFYGYDALRFPRRLHGLGAHWLQPVFRESACILTPCQEMVQDLAAIGADPERLLVLPWGIDTRRFRPRAAPPREGPVRFAIACRFTAKKGVEDLLAAFARVRRAGLEARLTVAGSGPLEARYRERAAALGIAAEVRFPGFVAAREMPAFLAGQDILVHPSVVDRAGDKEGSPTVIMEAAAAGLPVIATRHGGIPDIVRDGHSGFLVAEHNVEALAERMLRLGRDRQLWLRFGAAGRAHVCRHFDRETQNRRREELYDRLLQGEACTGASA